MMMIMKVVVGDIIVAAMAIIGVIEVCIFSIKLKSLER